MRVFGEYDIHKQEIIGGQLLQIVPFTDKRDVEMLLKKLQETCSRAMNGLKQYNDYQD